MSRIIHTVVILVVAISCNSVKPIPYLNNGQEWDQSIVVLGDWDGDPETPNTYLHWAPVNVGYDASGEIATRDDHRSGRLYQWGAEDDDTNKHAKMRYYNESKQKFWYTGMDVDVYYNGNKWKDNQGPCPTGWRLPTTQEMSCLMSGANGVNGWTTSGSYAGGISYVGAEFFGLNDDLTPGKGVFFPASGYIGGIYGEAKDYGETAGYWTSDAAAIDAGPVGNYSRAQANVLFITQDECSIKQVSHSYGYSVRCVRDDTSSLSKKSTSKSTSDYLKDITQKYNAFAEDIGNAQHEVEFDQIVEKYNQYHKSIPNSILEMPEDQIARIDGGREYLAAMDNYEQVYMAKSRFFAFADVAEPEYQNESAETPEQESDAIMDEILNRLYSEDNNEDCLLTPGVTYITMSSGTGTDEFGGRVSLSMEFTIYKDRTVTGNLIETNDENSYGNNHSYEHPLEGTWDEVSKHDKRFLKIDLVLESEDYYKEFTYYIDENHNAYANDINSRPVKLREK